MANTQLGLGLAALGRPEYINIRENSDIDKSEEDFKRNAFSVMNEAYKLGMRYFDTAPSYGKGEEFLNEWNRINNYSEVVLGTKWGYTYVANWELGFNGAHEIKEHSINKLIEQWDLSQQLLPNLKVYQVHSATFESGILENKSVLNQLYSIKKETGLQIGITTSGANQKAIIEAAYKVKIGGELLFDSFQVTYNIFEQSSFAILQKILQQEKTVIVKEALANGRVFENEKYIHYQESYKILKQLSEKYKVGIDAVVLRFVIDSLKPTYVLSGASNIIQLQQNIKTLSFNLSTQELDLLKSLKTDSEYYWEERSKMDWN